MEPWNLSDEMIEAARVYVAAVIRCEQTGKGWHDEKRQQANELAFKIVRWHGQ